MVFGMGEGSVAINTEKPYYAEGELLRGRASLDLNSARKARGFHIRFYGEIYVGSGRNRHLERVMVQEAMLDTEKEYPAGKRDYDFQFQLPKIPVQAPIATGIGVLDGLVNALTADPFARAQWFLEASLDIPMAVDIGKKQLVNFSKNPNPQP